MVEAKIDLHRILTDHEGPVHPDQRIFEHTVLQREFAKVVADSIVSASEHRVDSISVVL